MSIPKDLSTATAFSLRYMADFAPHTLMVSDPEAVSALLATIQIRDTKQGVFTLMLPMGLVTFTFPDGSTAELKILMANQAEYIDWGAVLLEPTFHAALNRLASEHAGRPIEVTENNM